MTIGALIPSVDELDSLDDPGSRIILSIERAKSWLAIALEGNQIEQLFEMKCQAEAIRIYTMQKALGKDAEIAAAEIVRRADRCIGLAVRKGQAEGRINKHGDQRSDQVHEADLRSPKEFFSNHGENSDTYAMTDGVTDEQFEAAIAAAKAEGNLSRANVVRKVKAAQSVDVIDPTKRWDKLDELAQSGCTSEQIAEKLGVHPETVRKKAREREITIQADVVMRKTHRVRLDHGRILGDIANTLDSLCLGCDQVDVGSVQRELLCQSLKIMDEAMPALSRLRKRIRSEVEKCPNE